MACWPVDMHHPSFLITCLPFVLGYCKVSQESEHVSALIAVRWKLLFWRRSRGVGGEKQNEGKEERKDC